MPEPQWDTDEDRKIYSLQVHKHLIGWLIEAMAAQGITAQRTVGDDVRGDILVVNAADIPAVQQLVRDLNARYNKQE
ncbi:hypothetical protein [Spirulina major]|uniref:hypothetical protein n=1 Tax=Spirulina major TaxID=270636 RepID=UPI0009349B10|nr:hypothetical protein [Spirulina major]